MSRPISRRDFVSGFAATSAMMAMSASPAGSRPSQPRIRGALWWYDPAQVSEQGWRKVIAQQQEIGFDLLWLCGTLSAKADLDSFRKLVGICERRRMKLLVDTASTAMWYGPCDLKAEIAVVRSHVAKLAPILRDSPAFFGWYVPHEIYWCEPGSVLGNFVRDFYPAAAETCRKATSGVPVTLSPFFILDTTKTFGDFTVPSPRQYQSYWTELNRRAGFDIIMLQDSGEHFAWVRDSERRPWFAAMKKACDSTGAKLWGNVECAEMNYSSIDEYIRANGEVHHSQAEQPRWRPVPMERFLSKMQLASEFSEHLVTWGYREFCQPESGPEAKSWYDSYRKYIKA